MLKELSEKLKLIPRGLSRIEQVNHREMKEIRRLANDLMAQLNKSGIALDK